jgi:hypothetical protein
MSTNMPANAPLPPDAPPPANAPLPAHVPSPANVSPPANTSPRPAKRGYHKLALFMSSQEDMAMFRRFTKLNMLNLMSLQAELMELETEFSAIWDSDEMSTQNHSFSLNFKLIRGERQPLSLCDDTTHKEDSDKPKYRSERQWEILMAIRTKLNEYSR